MVGTVRSPSDELEAAGIECISGVCSWSFTALNG